MPDGYLYTQDFVTQHAPRWLRLLERFRGAPGLRMLEIGSLEGRSAVWFLEQILTHPSASIVCVDWFGVPEQSARFDHNIGLTGAPEKVTKLAGTSHRLLRDMAEASFDIVYVDGSHRAADVLLDAMLSWYLLKPGGVLLFDDYAWELKLPPQERPQMAIDLFLRLLAGQYELLVRGYQVAVRKLGPRLPAELGSG